MTHPFGYDEPLALKVPGRHVGRPHPPLPHKPLAFGQEGTGVVGVILSQAILYGGMPERGATGPFPDFTY